ncbi:platelet glycoprotein Ib beta chain [Ambystoma mexicanum]|uniref:platelet glycoprotein Ib beta chain n=1 Tax=Ambystoma mexicanum TaxID=8296 RepID=UPI0037E87A45
MEVRCWAQTLAMLVLLPLVVSRCPPLCRCSSNIVDCSSKDLTEQNLPSSFPPSTEVIQLNQNRLTAIPNGLFDNLRQLQRVQLQQNPWCCDCSVMYLRAWLQKQQERALYKDVVCASPEKLRGRVIMYLTEDEILSTCQYWYCNMALISQICLFVFIAVQAILLIFVIIFLRRFQKIAKEARRTAKELYQNADNYTYDNYPAYNHGGT